MCHLSNKLFTIRNIIDIELVGSRYKLLLVILDDLVTCQRRLSVSLIDILKFEVGEEFRNDHVILQDGNLKFSVIEICHTNSYRIPSFIKRDTLQLVIFSLFDRVLIIRIAMSIAILLAQNIRINVNRVRAVIFFNDLCRILVSLFFAFVKYIFDLREYDITVIYISFRVLRRDNSVVCVIQRRFECEFFYSEFSAFDGLLGAKHQFSFSVVLI